MVNREDVPPVVKTLSARMIELTRKFHESGCELFTVESPANKYRPAPPEGFVAFRSHKRRLFIAGTWPKNSADLEAVNAKIKAGNFIESPLVDSTVPVTPPSIIDYIRP